MSFHTRIKHDIVEMEQRPPRGVNIGPVGDNTALWSGVVFGPTGSYYDGGDFVLGTEIKFPEAYPIKQPELKFKTRIWHPNVGENGEICERSLWGERWTPATQISDLLKTLVLLLEHPTEETPLNAAAAVQLRENKAEFERKARDWTRTYAAPQ